MRDIYICDEQGNLLKSEGYYAFPEAIWIATFQYIQEQGDLPILKELWQYYYGEKGDAFLPPTKVKQLLKEIQFLQLHLNDIQPLAIENAQTNLQEIQHFFTNLLTLCQTAKTRDRALRFIAD